MSTLSSSAAPRGTPGMNVPASQNTAPVIKFRCLYTHDLRRKAKRWQDGYLRYHTFNKRIMVFDTTGNFIGDQHWRQDEGPQDGDELELDKGVLIEVGECMEKTDSDISSLFEKKKASQASPARPIDPSTPSVRPSPTPVRSAMSSQSSRSLNDLLGIKRTPVGQMLSPYEERHGSQVGNIQPSEPAAKRQKTVSSAPSEQRPRHTSPPVRADPVLIDLEQLGPATREKEQAPTPKPSKSGVGILRNSTTSRTASVSSTDPKTRPESQVQKNPTPKQSESGVGSTNSTISRTTSASSKDPKPRPETQMPNNATSRSILSAPPENTRPTAPKGPIPSDKAQPSAFRALGSSLNTETPTNTLRISSQKPRKKLMYSELLRSQSSKSSPEPSSAKSSPQIAPKRAGHVEPGSEPEPEAAILEPDPVSTTVDFMPSDATQFVLDELVDDPMLDQPSPPIPIKTEPASQGPGLQPPPDRTTSRQHLSPPNQQESSQTGPNPRVPVPTSMPPSVVPHPRGLVLQARASNSGLRKSYSDPTALLTPNVPRRLPRSPLSMPVDNGPDQGPWTSEALDLLDFWPPGRPKPG